MVRKSNPILDTLQTVPTIEDTNITKAKLPTDKDIVICYLEYGRMQDLPRGPNFWGSGRVACREASRVIRVHAPPRNFFKWYNLVHIFINFYFKKVQFIM